MVVVAGSVVVGTVVVDLVVVDSVTVVVFSIEEWFKLGSPYYNVNF